MPRRSAAWMTVRPSGTSTFRPSISSVGMDATLHDRRPDRAVPDGGVLLELRAVLGDHGANRHRRRVRERADGGAHHVARDVEQEIDVAGIGAAVLELLERPVEPAGSL